MKRIYFLTGIGIMVMLFCGYVAHSQQSDCKVLIPALSGNYSGKCKNGLANGNGIAHGIDKYEGQFNKGLPHGNGIYTWTNGSYYDGKWVEGQKDGQGKMVYINTSVGDSVVEGYWKNDKYIGNVFVPPYKVTRTVNIDHYSFVKNNDSGFNVVFKFLLKGQVNSDIESLSITNDSGSEYQSGNSIGIQSPKFPLNVKIRYRTWNQIHGAQSDANIEFIINDPGMWSVTINN